MNKVKVRVIQSPEGVFPEYQPIVGEIYEAEYCDGHKRSENGFGYNKEFCIINILDKRIVLRKDEFEIVGGNGNVKD